MPRKGRGKPAPTEAEQQAAATAAHHQHLAEHPLPDTSTDFDPAALEAQPPASPPELVTNPAAPIVQGVADATRMPDDEDAERAKYGGPESHRDHTAISPETHGDRTQIAQEPLAGRDWKQFMDPARRQSVRFDDGYEIAVQESPSRRTVEIQFGDGGRNARPMHSEAINYLKSEGMHWNGTNAWVKELAAPRGHESEAEKIDRQRHNARIRAHVEDEVFPQVVALEEEKRGPVGSDVIRDRINQLAAERGR